MLQPRTKTKKILSLLFTVFILLNNSHAGAFDEMGDNLFDKKRIETPEVLVMQQPLEKPPIEFIAGDLAVTFGGKVRVEHYTHLNPVYLNKKTPDGFGGFKQTVDLNLDVVCGEKKCGHKAFELYLSLRSKSRWGVVGSYKNSTLTETSLGGISLGEHSHKASRPNPWFKDAWMQLSLNRAFNSENKKIHYLKAGWFPFQLGRGVAFGPYYAVVYEFLGLFSYSADASAPGINVNGEILKDKLWYDLYYSKFEDNSASVFNVMKTVNENRVGRRSSPYRGEGKDDELWALRLRAKPFDKESSGRLELEPYVFFNEASDQKVEISSDTKTQLGAYGMEVRYKKNKFKIDAEVAFNYGQQKLYSIDRNEVKLLSLRTDGDIPESTANMVDEDSGQRGAGLLYKGYSHVVINSGGDLNEKKAPVNDASTAAAYNDTNITKAVGVAYGPNGILKNLENRVRPEYTNKFNGWMGIIDARYKVAKNFKIAAEAGYVSGDNDPHINEVDKNYDGFVALHSLYIGKTVLAPLFLGERYIARPLGLIRGKKEVEGFRAKTNNTFSDLKYVGIGATWKPERYVQNRFKINPNTVFFWRDNESYKYVIDESNPDNNQVSNTEKASNFFGTELNVIFNYELIKDLTLAGIFSVFVPGSYYKDVKGVPLRGDFYRDVLSSDLRVVVNPLDYRMSDDLEFYAVVSLEYRF